MIKLYGPNIILHNYNVISQEVIEKILDIEADVDIDPYIMASKLSITVFPFDHKNQSTEVLYFLDKLITNLAELGVKIIPYSDALQSVSINRISIRFLKIVTNNLLAFLLNVFGIDHSYYHIHWLALVNILKQKRIRKGISIIALGTNQVSDLPIDYTSSFHRNSIITILDAPEGMTEETNFLKHFDNAMKIFAYHMTHLALLVDKKKWILYNFNASHPVYPIESDFKKNLLYALIPKIWAPIQPPVLHDFIIDREPFDVDSHIYTDIIDDLINGARMFDRTGLYPPGKKVEDLPFRNGFYKWIGKIHLDHRNGMSYGFLAVQVPVVTERIVPIAQFRKDNPSMDISNGFASGDNGKYIIINIGKSQYVIKVPTVWVVTQRSGSDKTNINPKKDLILIGLQDGKMHMRLPPGYKMKRDYKPSFDTRVILAHALGNAIIASILEFSKSSGQAGADFLKKITKKGMALIHWHGYIQKRFIPNGWYIYGNMNPHVACSTAQSAIFALQGKLNSFESAYLKGELYNGDIHVEPHHGSNMCFSSISDMARFILSNREISELGNKYLTE